MSLDPSPEWAQGEAAAHEALMKLFEKAQSLRGQGKPVSSATLAMTRSHFPAYKDLQGLEAHEAFDALIRRAQQADAITAKPTREGGDSAGWAQLRAHDLTCLASFLGLPLRHEQVALARLSLADAFSEHPVLERILAQWNKGASVRGRDVYALGSLMDAIKVVASSHQSGLAERLIRKESVLLFGHSKRLETLTVWLDILASGELAATGLSDAEIWAQYGLRREPQPLLLSGTGLVGINGTKVALCRPYLGLPPLAMEAPALQGQFLLSIENLTSYHEFIALFPEHCGLVVFTAGMPSPAWRRAYGLLVDALPQAQLLHWGDIDQGGFRIAAKIAEVCHARGRALMPWMMESSAVPDRMLNARTIPGPSQLKAMLDWSRRAGWPEVAHSLEARPVVIEQEQLTPALP